MEITLKKPAKRSQFGKKANVAIADSQRRIEKMEKLTNEQKQVISEKLCVDTKYVDRIYEEFEQYSGYEYDNFIEDIDNCYYTTNECRDGRKVVWYLDSEAKNEVVYDFVNDTFLDEDEAEEQLY